MHGSYRLGLDIGANSIGWCILELDSKDRPCALRDIGVRIFSDGRKADGKTSLAVERRLARQQRRQIDRRLKRKTELMAALVRHGLMPVDEGERKSLENLNPYELRAHGLSEPLPDYAFGRAIFHLAQRRGFKSNRKTDKPEESGIVKAAIGELDRRMQHSQTVGQYFHKRHKRGKPVRRQYTSRDMFEKEFDELWRVQAAHNPRLDNEGIREKIRKIIFYQRPLKPVQPGRCELDPDEYRGPKALPTFQRHRILQDLGNLRIIDTDLNEHALSREQRDALLAKLLRQKTVGWKTVRKLLNINESFGINFERDPKRKGLEGDATGASIAKIYGPNWFDLSLEAQDSFVQALLDAKTDDEAIAAGIAQGLELDAAKAIASLSLTPGYGRLSQKVMSLLVEVMTEQGLGYAAAAQEVGYHHSDQRLENLLDRLPYYGEVLPRSVVGGTGKVDDPIEIRVGKIPNPAVHVGLNQLTKLVNAIIETYGKPKQIVIELARDLKLSAKQRDALVKQQKQNQDDNEKIDAELAKHGIAHPTRSDRQKYKLWREADGVCVFTGMPISPENLFSYGVDFEHLLPRGKSLDDSLANKVVTFRWVNDVKGDSSPHAAFGHSPSYNGHQFDYAGILARARKLQPNKRWRFSADAMQRLADDGDYLARHLNDTRYLSRIARELLSAVCPKVWVVPGQLTAMLRAKWDLNSILPSANWDVAYGELGQETKNRLDHRHHAVDAVIVGCTDRDILNAIAAAEPDARGYMTISPPWDSLREDVRRRTLSMPVSHKPDHKLNRGRPVHGDSTSGQLHRATALGIIGAPDKSGMVSTVHRAAIEELSLSDVAHIRDKDLRERLQDHLQRAAQSEKLSPAQTRHAISEFCQNEKLTGHTVPRRIRLIERFSIKSLVPIRDKTGGVYKAYKGDSNAYMDILQLTDGKWRGHICTTFQANQLNTNDLPPWQEKWPAAKRMMRLFNGDMAKLEVDGVDTLVTIIKMSGENIVMARHHDSGPLSKRNLNSDDPFNYIERRASKLKALGFRKVSVDVLGRVRDCRKNERRTA